MKTYRAVLTVLAATQILALTALPAVAGQAVLDNGARIYLSLDELVSSRRGGDDVGTIVRCRVWRDVETSGIVFIKAGTPATCRVDKVGRRNIGGFEGHISVAAVETRSVDGQTVTLAGGYHKEGGGHKAVVLTVGLLLFWPALFVPGGNAELPPGTVFDASTVNDLKVATVDNTPAKIDLRGLTPGSDVLSAQFMLDDFVAQPKHDIFRIAVTKGAALPSRLVIDSVNGKSIEPIALAIKPGVTKDGQATGVAEVAARDVAKHFAKGINRFEVSYDEGGVRKATEVVMDVQM